MVVDGKTHVAQVLEKEVAEERYQEARRRNQTAGQVKQVPVKLERGMELFEISINLAPGASALFTLVYNELLERRRGVYKQTLVVKPGTIVDDLSVSASFAERQGFNYFAYSLPGSDTKLTSSSADQQTQVKASVSSREVVFRPSVEMQRKFNYKEGIAGEFNVYYSVNSDPEGGSIIVQNEYFAHFFAPAELDSLPKNILFIIDISGSMSGSKIHQAQQAMLKILDDLAIRATDKFNILLFDDKIEMWQRFPASTLAFEIDKAKGFVRDKLVSRGGTDIHLALTEGLDLLLSKQEKQSCNTADMVVFLTDGDPTYGITDIDRIIGDVTTKNKGRASIHTLGFGFNLNFGFLSKLSLRNQGFVRRIYEDVDAKEQLRNFYDEISKPVLCNVVAHYSTDVVTTDLLTVHDFPIYFDGKEIIVAGKTRLLDTHIDPASWDAKLTGSGANGMVDFVVPVGQVRVVGAESGIEDDLTEKLWAYMKIKSLLEEMERLDSEDDRAPLRTQALNMSLTYGFVTPLTSFSIVVDSRPEGAMEDMMRADNNKRYYAGGYPSGQACGWRLSWVLVVCSLLIGRLLSLQ
ncbi:inter-alpha-trypsin inhibitor heavy chain H3-like isoform X2 [Babylonia areolata]